MTNSFIEGLLKVPEHISGFRSTNRLALSLAGSENHTNGESRLLLLQLCYLHSLKVLYGQFASKGYYGPPFPLYCAYLFLLPILKR